MKRKYLLYLASSSLLVAPAIAASCGGQVQSKNPVDDLLSQIDSNKQTIASNEQIYRASLQTYRDKSLANHKAVFARKLDYQAKALELTLLQKALDSLNDKLQRNEQFKATVATEIQTLKTSLSTALTARTLSGTSLAEQQARLTELQQRYDQAIADQKAAEASKDTLEAEVTQAQAALSAKQAELAALAPTAAAATGAFEISKSDIANTQALIDKLDELKNKIKTAYDSNAEINLQILVKSSATDNVQPLVVTRESVSAANRAENTKFLNELSYELWMKFKSTSNPMWAQVWRPISGATATNAFTKLKAAAGTQAANVIKIATKIGEFSFS